MKFFISNLLIRTPNKFWNIKHFWVVLMRFKDTKWMKDKFGFVYQDFFLLELANKFHNGKYFWVAFLYFMELVNKGQTLNFCRHFFMENSWRTSKYLDLLDSQNESVIQTLLRWLGHKLKNGENLDSSWKPFFKS